MQNETSNLASLSTAIRESSLKRLRVVPVEQENWQPVSGAMSIAGIAQHILDADLWLFRKLENPLLQAIKASADASHVRNHQEYLDILVNLEQTGRQRSSLIQALTQEQLARLIPDERFGPQVSV